MPPINYSAIKHAPGIARGESLVRLLQLTFHFSMHLLFPGVLSIPYISSQWLNSEYCSGPPDIMYEFDVSDPDALDRLQNETWPGIYSLGAPVYPNSYCGNTYISLEPLQCCLSAIRPAEARGYKSGIAIAKGKGDYPIGSSSKIYCDIAPINGTIFGYHEILVLANSGCQDGRFRCDSNGTLSLYEQSNCSGAFQNFETRNSPLIINDTPVSLSLNTTKGTGRVGWTTYLLPEQMVPDFTRAGDWFGLLASIIAIVCSLYPAYYSALEWHKIHNLYSFLMFTSQFLLFIWVVLRVIYVHTPFEYPVQMHHLGNIEKISLNIATVAMFVYSCKFIIEVFSITKRYIKIGLYLGAFIVHFIFSGSRYFMYLYAIEGAPNPFEPFLDSWYDTGYIMFPILFAFEVVPIIYSMVLFSAKIPKDKNPLLDSVMIYCLMLHIVNSIAYVVSGIVQRTTLLLGNDRSYFTIQLWQVASLAAHATLNVFMMERLRKMLKTHLRPAKSPASKPVTLNSTARIVAQ